MPNSYLGDKESISRVKLAIVADGRFAETSVWAEAQDRLVRGLDDEEAVWGAAGGISRPLHFANGPLEAKRQQVFAGHCHHGNTQQ